MTDTCPLESDLSCVPPALCPKTLFADDHDHRHIVMQGYWFGRALWETTRGSARIDLIRPSR